MELNEIKDYLEKIDVKNLSLEDLSNYIKCEILISKYETEKLIRTKIVQNEHKIL